MGARPAIGARITTVAHSLRTVFAFGVFCVWALALTVFALPLLRRSGGGDPQRRVQALLHRSARGFLAFADRLGFLRAPARGLPGLEGPGPWLLVANHPSMLDAIVLVARLPQVDCVVHSAWLRHPVLGALARAAGHVANEPGPAVVDACAGRLAAGRTVVIFPEGTRSPEGGLGPFQRGAARIALRSGMPLTPLVFRYEPLAFTRGQSWYDAPKERFRVGIRVLDSISPAGVVRSGSPDSIAARRLTAELRETIEKALENGRAP